LALDQATGAIVWGPISIVGNASAAYEAGSVFVISNSLSNGQDQMQAFDVATGAPKWATTLISQNAISGITALNGVVFTGDDGDGGTLYAIDESDGTSMWFTGFPGTPAVTTDGVYITYSCTTYAMNPSTGAPLWDIGSAGCSGRGGGSPVVANGVLYAPATTAYSGSTFNAQTGQPIGTFVADSPPALGTQTGYFLQSGTLRAIDLTSNSVVWSFAGDSHLVTSPILINQYVVVGSSTGNVYGLDGVTGNVIWQSNVGATIPTSPGVNIPTPWSGLSAGDGLLIVPAGNTVTAYTLSTNP
jgi:outer membrane protein assembly factor BamB